MFVMFIFNNDGERHIPYIMVFPDSLMNKMRAWAAYQDEFTGMIKEQLRCGCQTLPIDPIVSPPFIKLFRSSHYIINQLVRCLNFLAYNITLFIDVII